jgi:hypothetical protein
MSEGTADYLAASVLEEIGETDAAAARWDSYERDAMAHGASGSVIAWPSGCGAIDIATSGLAGRETYAKGALFYRSLEQKIGRPALDAALKAFYETRVGEPAGMQDLLDTVRDTSGYDPQACADLWLRTRAVAPFVPCE